MQANEMKVCIRILAITAIGAGMTLMLPPARANGAASLEQACPAAAAWEQGLEQRQHARTLAFKNIKPSDPALAQQLAERAARDQAAREAVFNKAFGATGKPDPAALKQMLAVDQDNLTWLKPQIKAHGFPTVRQVGLKGVEHAWLLVQHAIRDPAFQARVLAELKPRLQTESFLRPDYALLSDRVLLAQHKQQIYGTQFTVKNGELVLRPTQDQAGLAKRRAQMELPPMADYRCILRAMYHISARTSTTASHH